MASFRMGSAAGTDIPIEHLDYDYVGKCSSASELEEILKALRSNKEGHYPKLIAFTEERLRKVHPNSKLLLVEQKVKRVGELPDQEQREIAADLESWREHVTAADSAFQSGVGREVAEGEEDSLPPVRTASTITGSTAPPKPKEQTSERIKSTDFKAWDRYDVEKEAEKVDTQHSADPKPSGQQTSVPSELSDKEKNLSAAEKERLATREKEKGNEAFRASDYREALAYYTRSVKLCPTAAAYNNRAITGIKLEMFSEAVADCSAVLRMEPDNIKALLRRATALTSLKEHGEAASSLERVLALEPNNKKAQEQLNALRKTAEGEGDGREGGARKKGRRIQIQEVEGSGSEEEDGGEARSPQARAQVVGGTPGPVMNGPVRPARGGGEREAELRQSVTAAEARTETDGSAFSASHSETSSRPAPTSEGGQKPADGLRQPKPSENGAATASPHSEPSVPVRSPSPPPPPPLPLHVQRLKDKGNGLFKSGQYGEAVQWYTNALQQLEKKGKDHESSLATLLNNRAACHLKNGDCKSCIDDATRSLSLLPLNLKALLRRASAYEMMEKYKRAYSDYQLALRVDSSVTSAYDASSRISVLLRSQEGNDWRSKLPPNPDTGRVLAALTAASQRAHATASSTQAEDTLQSQPSGTTPPADKPTGHTSQPSPTPDHTPSPAREREASTEEQFEQCKARGNEHVKKSEFAEALNCYSECIRLCPSVTVAYTNRALCHLRLMSPKSAVEDCSKALELDSSNVKALYRRGLARKALRQYSEAARDLKTLLDIEQTNSVASKELDVVKQLWEKELRELQSKQPAPKTPQKKTPTKSPSGKEKKAASSQKRTRSTQNGTKKSSRQQASSNRSPLHAQRATASTHVRKAAVDSRLSDERTRPSAAAQGDDLLTATKTTYYKGKEEEDKTTSKDEGTDRRDVGARRRRIVIEEREGSSDDEATTSASAGANPAAKEQRQPQETVTPVQRTARGTGSGMEKLASPFEFVQKWNTIPRTAQSIEYASLLEQIPPDILPEVITNKLDGMMLTNIIRAISKQFIPRGMYQVCVDILHNLTKVPRFGMIAMFLSPKEKQDLQEVFSALSTQQTIKIPTSTMAHLSKSYGLDV